MRINKFYTLLFPLLLFFQISYSQPSYTEIDLRDNPTDAKNYVGIAIRNNTSTGHAFVILCKENDKKQVTELSVQGFYHKGIVPINAEGLVREDFGSLKYVRKADQLYFVVNDNDYNSAVKLVTQWTQDPPKYHLIYYNCIDLTRNVAEAIGVELPSRRMTSWGSSTPAGYLKLINKKLYSNTGLVYKKNSKILGLSNGIYIGPVKNGVPEGNGKLVSAVDQYNGPFKNGKPNGNGELTMEGSCVKIIGNFIDGKPEGKVQISQGSDGGISTAEIKNGKYVGQRETTYKDGSKHITETDQYGIPQGMVKVVGSDNSISNFYVKDGKYVSPIETKYKDGSKLTTQIDQNGVPLSSTFEGSDGRKETIKYNEKGERSSLSYTSSDKSVEINIDKFYPGRSDSMHGTAKGKDYTYSGEMKSFLFNGKGVLTMGNNKWEGDYKNGRFEGKNNHIEINRITFDGDIWYDENHSYQKGLLKFSNGDTYNGELRDFVFHGNGRLIHHGEADCFLFGLLCNGNKSFDITDIFTNGSSPRLQGMGIGPPPSASFPDNEPFKVPINIPDNIKKDEIKTNPVNENPFDYSNLDPVPKPQLKTLPPPNSNNSYWDPVKKKRILL